MKKTFLFLAILIGSLSTTQVSANNVTTVKLEQQNNSTWEKLGTVQLVGYVSLPGTLYVKVIGEKYFYKVVIYYRNHKEEYSVSLGKYTHNGKSYNAKAGDYYFNL